jgi:tetratricopeptide (TPR) repeat protein
LDKNNPRFLANIGYIYFWKEDYDKASEYYNKALDINDDPTALKYIAELEYRLRKYDDAINYYNQILQKYPDSPEILTHLSEIYSLSETEFQNRDLNRSLEYARLAIEKAPNEYEPYAAIAIAFKELGDFDNAIINLNKAIELNKTDPTLYLDLGTVYLEIPDYQEAVKQFERAVSLKPEDPNNYSWLAHSYDKIHNWDKALYYAEIADKKAKARNPKDDKYLEYIARVYHDKGLDYYNQGKLDEAIEEYKKANAIIENAVTYYNLYLCYLNSEPKRNVEARKAIIKAIDLSPRVNPDYTDALSKLPPS